MTHDPSNISQPNLIDRVKSSIVALDTDTATKDDALTALMFAKRLKEVARELSEQVEAGVIKLINRQGEIVDGSVRYYVGVVNTIKCLDVKATLEAILEASGGDCDAAVACMSANAWKPGASKKLLPPEVYDALFQSTVDDELREGKAKPDKLIKFDERFAR